MTSKMTDSSLENITKEVENSCVISPAEQVQEINKKDKETLQQLENGDLSRTIPSETFVHSSEGQRKIINSESHVQNDNANQNIINTEADSHDGLSSVNIGQPTIHSLTCSTMSDVPLTLPLCPPRFLNISFLTEEMSVRSVRFLCFTL